MQCFYVLEQSYTVNKNNVSGSIVPKLEAAMGPRMTAGASGPQHAFIQRKTALSKHIQARLGDGPNDWGTPRGPGRYLTSQAETTTVKIMFPTYSSLQFFFRHGLHVIAFILFNVCSGHGVVMVTEAERISPHRLQRKSQLWRLHCLCCPCLLSRMWATTAEGKRKCGFLFSRT